LTFEVLKEKDSMPEGPSIIILKEEMQSLKGINSRSDDLCLIKTATTDPCQTETV
jgi:hypothetical protein